MKQDQEETELRVKRVLMDEFGLDDDEVTPEATLIDDLGMNDNYRVELSIRLEEEFGIAIPDEDIDQVQTVKDLYQCVIRHGG